MTVPDFQSLMLPLLRLADDGNQHSLSEAVERLAGEFQLSTEDRAQVLKSGQTRLYNRVGWSTTYLKKAGLLRAADLGDSNSPSVDARLWRGSPSPSTWPSCRPTSPRWLRFDGHARGLIPMKHPPSSTPQAPHGYTDQAWRSGSGKCWSTSSRMNRLDTLRFASWRSQSRTLTRSDQTPGTSARLTKDFD